MTPQIEFVFNQLDDSLKKEIIDFWVGEKALGVEQAHQRVNEIALIARGSESKIMGVCTIRDYYFKPIGKNFWYFRTFVSKDYRQHGVAIGLLSETKRRMNEQFKAGKNPKIIGIIIKVENPILKQNFPQATWPRTQFHFVGTEGDSHIRISYFEGATID